MIMSRLHFQPIKGQARAIVRAILDSPELSACGVKKRLALRLACEEIVVNVASYAYPEGKDGYLDVDIQKTDRIVIRFEDGGVPFNPLEHKLPDIKQSWKQRGIGGLGIFLVIKNMDNLRYEYVDNKNVLTIEKMI